MDVSAPNAGWPALPWSEWKDTCETLHLWTQVVGKVRLAFSPWLNHGWQVPLYVTARGLGTSSIPHGARVFEITFDFLAHVLDIQVSDGTRRQIALQPQTVASFRAAVLGSLSELGLNVSVSDLPCEIEGAIPFSRDETHRVYEASKARTFWHALLQIDRVFKQFRTGFLGKASPVHFFWGGFDLAVTRFSGRPAPRYEGRIPGLNIEVMREAYSHEVSSAGFWPGGNGVDDAFFYSYAYPTPEDFKRQPVQPREAYFSETLGEFLLPYDAVRNSTDPDATLHAFLQSTYDAAARTANWDRAALECAQGRPGVLRTS
jgi:hypothetical protein